MLKYLLIALANCESLQGEEIVCESKNDKLSVDSIACNFKAADLSQLVDEIKEPDFEIPDEVNKINRTFKVIEFENIDEALSTLNDPWNFDKTWTLEDRNPTFYQPFDWRDYPEKPYEKRSDGMILRDLTAY